VVEERKKIGKDGLVGVFEGLLFLAGEALAGVFKVGTDTKKLVLERGNFCRRVGLGGGGRGGWCRLSIWQNDLWFFGGRVAGVLGVLGFHGFRSKKRIRIRCRSYCLEGRCQQDAKRPVRLGLR